MRAFATVAVSGWLAAVAAGPVALAGPDKTSKNPDSIDLSSVRDKLVVLHDGSGHYVIVEPYELGDHLYYGDGKTFHAQRLYSGYSDQGSGSFSRRFWSPRVDHVGELSVKNGTEWKVQCGERETPMVVLSEKDAKAILDRAVVKPPLWRRTAYALSRDDRGNYYYVDRLQDRFGGKGFRLFIGPKGRLKEARMINIVSDSEGDIFATRSGQLRLILREDKSTWVEGKSRTDLTIVPPIRNLVLIYSELGVYRGDLGTPCDDL